MIEIYWIYNFASWFSLSHDIFILGLRLFTKIEDGVTSWATGAKSVHYLKISWSQYLKSPTISSNPCLKPCIFPLKLPWQNSENKCNMKYTVLLCLSWELYIWKFFSVSHPVVFNHFYPSEGLINTCIHLYQSFSSRKQVSSSTWTCVANFLFLLDCFLLLLLLLVSV